MANKTSAYINLGNYRVKREATCWIRPKEERRFIETNLRPHTERQIPLCPSFARTADNFSFLVKHETSIYSVNFTLNLKAHWFKIKKYVRRLGKPD